MELMLTFGTGDFLIACASFHAEQYFTLRAAEVFVILFFFLPQNKLAGFGFRIG